MPSDRDLQGRPIAITGASSGIGLATARACARLGMPVALSARRADRLDDAVRMIRDAGGRAIAVPGDVARAEDCRALVAAAEREFGPLYAAFANAGYGWEGSVLGTPDEKVRAMWETNFWGTMHLIRASAPGMIERGRGHLLLCSSCLAKTGMPLYSAYSASKACQDHVGRALRLEVRHRGVFVSTVHPIGTRTEFFETAHRNSEGGSMLAGGAGDRFMQPVERVADRIVACLRRPKGEVWPSPLARLGFAALTAFPGLADRVLERRMRERLRRL